MLSKNLKPVLFLSVLSLVGCASQKDVATAMNPFLKEGSHPGFNENGGTPVNPTTPATVTNHYEASAKDDCLAAWNWKQVRYAVCSNQGGYSFLDFTGSNFEHPEQIKVVRKSAAGSVRESYENPRVTPTGSGRSDLTFSQNLSFSGVEFSKAPPSLGYAVLGGNSGSCTPLISGSPASCYQVFKSNSNSYSDTVPAPLFHFAADSVIHVEGCDLKVAKDSSGSSIYSSIEWFKVANTTPCQLGGGLWPTGSKIGFDLKEPANFPLLKTPRS